MLLPLLVAATLAAQQPAPPRQTCFDPAAPLLELARDYDRWPQPSTERSTTAFALLKEYLRNPTPSAYHEALAEYQWLERQHRTDLHVRFGLGILYATGPDMNYPGASGYRHNALAVNSNADDWAAEALTLVARRDAKQWLPAVALTRVALVSPEEKRMQQAEDAVRRILRADSTVVAARLALHDLLIAQDRAGEALAFGSRFPLSCTPLRHARAEALMLTGDTAAGVRLYLDALQSAGDDELHRFYDDIRVMATLGQLNDYQATSPARRRDWIMSLWKYNATAYARTLEARVGEQIVRAAFADRNFRAHMFDVSSDKPVGWINDTAHIVPWDARGVLHVRHGAPLHRYRILNQCTETLEAWVYSAEDVPWVFWFGRPCFSTGDGAQQDWAPMFAPPRCGKAFLTRPIPTLADALQKLKTKPESIDRRDIYLLVAQFDPRYDVLFQECSKEALGAPSPVVADLMQRMWRSGKDQIEQAEWSESAAPHIARRAPMILAAYEFRNAQRKPEIVALSWLSIGELQDPALPLRSMKYSYILTDSVLGAVRVDTVVVVPQNSASGALLRSSVTLPNLDFKPNNIRVIALDAADTTRGSIRSAPINLRGTANDKELSDVVIAVPGSTGPLRRGAYQLAPIPGHRVRMNEPFRLFFELYGAAAGDSVVTTIAVSRTDKSTLAQLRTLFPGREAERTLRFPRRAETDARGVVVQDIDVMADLVPGEYEVRVSVEINGATVTRRTAMHIIDPTRN